MLANGLLTILRFRCLVVFFFGTPHPRRSDGGGGSRAQYEETILDLKKKVEEATGVPVDKQLLFWHFKELTEEYNNKTLLDLNLHTGFSLTGYDLVSHAASHRAVSRSHSLAPSRPHARKQPRSQANPPLGTSFPFRLLPLCWTRTQHSTCARWDSGRPRSPTTGPR